MSQTTLDLDADIVRDVERLKTLAGELALKAGRHGVTVSDLRLAAVRAGILTGGESDTRMKRLNLGKIARLAGLKATDRFRRSDVARAHGNLNRVHVLPEFAEVA